MPLDDASAADPLHLMPLDHPWTRRDALRHGISDTRLQTLLRHGAVRRVVRGVYVATSRPDSLQLRLQALSLVCPPGGVVVDSTAAWLHAGDAVLGPGEHVRPPHPQIFDGRDHHRLAGAGVRSGARSFTADDVVTVQGLTVTSPLRTACDVARLEDPVRALAVGDALERAGLTSREEVVDAMRRFRGFRGVVRARQIVSWIDGRSESYSESGLRLRWLDTPGLPVPVPQMRVLRPDGGSWFLDLGAEDLPFGAEYDGLAFHGPEHAAHDEWRRQVMRDALGLHIEVFGTRNVFGASHDAGQRMAAAVRELRRRRGTVVDLRGEAWRPVRERRRRTSIRGPG